MLYDRYRYIYPPRPKNATTIDKLDYFDDGTFIAQNKWNGSNCLLFTNGDTQFIMNRDNERMSNFRISKEELDQISPKGVWNVFNGEYLNKNKMYGKDSFNHKLILYDILVHNNNYLIGSTTEFRISLLGNMFSIKKEEELYYNITDNICLTKSFHYNFRRVYSYSSNDVIEGVVLKRKNAKLEVGFSDKNNGSKQMLKIRKPTKNYSF